MRVIRRLSSVAIAAAGMALLLVAVHASVPNVPANTWAPTGDLGSARAGASAALTNDGLVLVTGGRSGGVATASAERYSPEGGGFLATAPMSSPRADHTSTLLPDGRVLVAGGAASDGSALATTEIYDPAANVWTSGPSMHVARTRHSATLLSDGRIVFVGGEDSGVPTTSIETFDPATGALTASGAALSAPRTDHGAALLGDGRVLIAGGFDGLQPLSSVDVYDPASDSVAPAASMAVARAGLSITALLSGRVLVAGGAGPAGDLASAELYDPATGTFTPAGSLAIARQRHQAVLLPHNNQVLIVGGTSSGMAVAAAETFVEWQGAAGTFVAANATSIPRVASAGAALSFPASRTIRSGPADGLLLVAGGSDPAGGADAVRSADLYGFATVKTDHADYAPGQTVTITGSGWEPGETVTLQLVEDPLLDDHGPYTIVADSAGNISDTSFVPDEHDLSVRFVLTATGSRSQARTVFTDASIAAAPITIKNAPCVTAQTNFAPGATVCASVAVTTSGGGGNPDLVIEWFNPSSTLVRTTTKTAVANGSTAIDTLALTGANAVAGTWTVQSCKNTGCNGGNLVDSATFTVTGSVTTSTSITASPASPSAYGQAVTFTAHVAPGSGSTGPTGSVQFLIDGVAFGSPLPVAACTPSPNVCAASGSASALSAGSHDIAANFTATGSFSSSSGTLTQAVNAAPLTITANSDSKTYGDARTYGPGSTAFIAAGLLNSETIDSVTITASGGAAAIAAAGTYSLTPSAATGGTFVATNYAITYKPGTLTVNAAVLDITANGDSKTYGDTRTYGPRSSAFTPGANQLKNGDAIGTLTITDLNGGGVATAAAGGSYPLVPSAATGGTFVPANYTIQYHSGSLTVTAAPLDITANNDSKTYGDTKGYGAGQTTFSTAVGQLKNGDKVGSVTIADVNGGGLATAAAGGSYPLRPSAATGGTFVPTNYVIHYIDGALTVSAAPLDITANNDSKTYGEVRTYGAGSGAFLTGSGQLKNGDAIGTVTITDVNGGGLATAAAGGSYPLRPSAATGGTFLATNYVITYKPGALTVNAAPLDVTANNDSKTYGDVKTYGAGSAAFTTGAGQLKNGDAIGSVTITDVNGGGLATAAAGGSYPLRPSAATGGTFLATNYVITYKPGALTVNAAPLDVTANNDSKTYGEVRTYGAGSSAFTTGAGQLKNGDAIGTVTITDINGGGLATAAAGGAYPLRPSAATGGTFLATNYVITYKPGALTVNAAPLDVTANNDSKTYGDVKTYGAGSAAFTTGAGQLKNGDTIGSVTITDNGGGLATAAAGGSYPLRPSVATGGTFVATNYVIHYIDGALTVSAAPLDVTANNDSKTYGDVKTYGAGSAAFTTGAGQLKNGDTIGSVTITDNGGGLATAAAGGSYPLRPSVATGGTFVATNYVIHYIDGALTVSAAPLDVTASNDSKTYGDVKTYGAGSSAFTTGAGQLKNGDTIGSVTIGDINGGGLATAAAGGSYPLRPSVATGGTFVATNYVIHYIDGALTVNAAPLDITASNDSKTYGDVKTYGAGSAAFTTGAGQLKNGDTIGSVTITDNGGGLATAAAGGYSLVPTAATGGTFIAANYTIQYHNGTLTVSRAPLYLTASSDSKVYGQSRTYGAGSVAFAAGSGQLKNNETVGTVTITDVNNGGDPHAPVGGTYPLRPSAATGGTFAPPNYDIHYVDGALTVNVAVLTYVADAKSRPYGIANPALTGTIVGFVNNESPAVVAGALAFTTPATTSSDVGSYAINGSGLTSNNYVFVQAPANGTALTVTAWSLAGFYQPVAPWTAGAPVVFNSIKGGQTVPLKFNISYSAGGPAVTSLSAVSFSLDAVSCGTGTIIADVDPAFTTTGGTSLRYDSGQFIQNWQTPSQAGMCLRVTMTSQDKSTLVAFFKTK